MLIPNTNIYCTFKTSNRVPIDQVPYWRLYVIRLIRKPNCKTERQVAHKLICNYPLDDIVDLIQKLGDPNDNRSTNKYISYHYVAYPRNTRFNKT